MPCRLELSVLTVFSFHKKMLKTLIAFSVVPFGHFRVIRGLVTAVFMCVSEVLSVSLFYLVIVAMVLFLTCPLIQTMPNNV